MTEERNVNEATQEQSNATQAETSGKERGRTFTQEEVNAIVRDRLAREREKTAQRPENWEQKISDREQAVSARENLIACKEYIAAKKYPESLLNMYGTDNAEEFIASVDKLVKQFPAIINNDTGVFVTIGEFTGTNGKKEQKVNTGGEHGTGGVCPEFDKAFARPKFEMKKL